VTAGGSFDDVKQQLLLAIENRGPVVSHESFFLGSMMNTERSVKLSLALPGKLGRIARGHAGARVVFSLLKPSGSKEALMERNQGEYALEALRMRSP
jgi:hypothetical protein